MYVIRRFPKTENPESIHFGELLKVVLGNYRLGRIKARQFVDHWKQVPAHEPYGRYVSPEVRKLKPGQKHTDHNDVVMKAITDEEAAMILFGSQP